MDYYQARMQMIDHQVRSQKIQNARLIKAMSEIAREDFVLPQFRGVAYFDRSISLGDSRYALEPMVLARLLNGLDVQSDEIVLDVGSGLGYGAAILSRLASTVVALEQDEQLHLKAEETLSQSDYDNVICVQGDLTGGCEEYQPYDAILIEGAVSDVPSHFFDQLSQGGRLATVLKKPGGVGVVRIFQKQDGHVGHVNDSDAHVDYLKGFEPVERFVF